MKFNQLFKLSIIILVLTSCTNNSNELTYSWNNTVDRTWAGENFWANRLQDW